MPHETFWHRKLKRLKGENKKIKKKEASKKAELVQPLSSPHLTPRGVHHVQQNYVVHIPFVTPLRPPPLPKNLPHLLPKGHARPTQPSSQPIPTPLLPPFRPRHVSKWVSSPLLDPPLRARSQSFAAFAAILPSPNTASLALHSTLRPKRHLHPQSLLPPRGASKRRGDEWGKEVPTSHACN